MEYVSTLDDLMLQINVCRSNEAVMKVFNILYPYDKPLPAGKGDELMLQGFYGETPEKKWDPVQELKDCHPDVLKERLQNEAANTEKEALKQN